jgi:NADPH:quinone reductase-like Zn-dependent oxidoreductase
MSVQECVVLGDMRFDVVLDCVGGRLILDGWNDVADSGAYISAVPGFREPEDRRHPDVKSM